MKEALVRVTLLLASLLLVGLALEGGFRVIGARMPEVRTTGIYEPHGGPLGRPSLRPAPEPEPGATPFRLLAIGDSYTWGAGVLAPETWPRKLEYLLGRLAPGVEIEVPVLSRPGWNTELELVAARRRLRAEVPDLIVLGFCLNGAEPRRRNGLSDIVSLIKRRRPDEAWLSRGLVGRSHLFRAVWSRLENSRQRRGFRRYYRELYQREGWEVSRQALAGFKELADEHQVPLLVVVWPLFDQPIDDGYDYAPAHRLVNQRLAELGVRSLDLRRAFRGIDGRRLAVVPYTDAHPNELAHRIGAQTIARYLVAEGLTPIGEEMARELDEQMPRLARH